MKITIETTARPEKSQELYQVLQGLVPMIRKQKGCQSCRIHRDTENREIFFLTIEWDEQASLERYMATVGGAALLGAIDLLSETGRIRIGDDEAWGEIDRLKKMRNKQVKRS